MSDRVLADLWSALDCVVIERLSGGFVRVGEAPLPPWFVRVFIKAQSDGPAVALMDVFPVLDAFLAEAEDFWDRMVEGRLTGEAFMVTDSLGDELPVVVTAVGLNGRRFLLMQPDTSYAERHRVLQRAREEALAHEQVVRDIQDLRPPVSRIAAAAQELAPHVGSDEGRVQVDRIAEQARQLQEVLGRLPQRRKGASARR